MACYDYQDGRCTRGDRCRFSHDMGGGQMKERGRRRDDYQRGGRDNFRDDYRESGRRSNFRERDRNGGRDSRGGTGGRDSRGGTGGRDSRGGTGGIKVGTVRRLNEKGFGFIEYDTKSIFFHASAMTKGSFDDLREGDEVEFEAVLDDRTGKDRAENVVLL